MKRSETSPSVSSRNSASLTCVSAAGALPSRPTLQSSAARDSVLVPKKTRPPATARPAIEPPVHSGAGAPPASATRYSVSRPRTWDAKRIAFESGVQRKSSTQKSKSSVRPRTAPVVRSKSIRRKRSASKPARFCERYAIHLPSGE